jgi:hypothetical protein
MVVTIGSSKHACRVELGNVGAGHLGLLVRRGKIAERYCVP